MIYLFIVIGKERITGFIRIESPHKGAISGYPLGATEPTLFRPIRRRCLSTETHSSADTLKPGEVDSHHQGMGVNGNALYVVHTSNRLGLRGIVDGLNRELLDRELRILGIAGRRDKYIVASYPLDSDTPSDNFGLGKRERQVISLAARGLNRREIAEKLLIACSTVRNHTTDACRKMGASNMTEAVLTAAKRRLIPIKEVDLRIVPVEQFDMLSREEKQILREMIGDNVDQAPKSFDKEIAAVCGWTYNQVRYHLDVIKESLGVRNKAQLALWYWLYQTQRDHILQLRESQQSM